MGIRGLTTYLNNQPKKYFVEHQLCDCYVIVDGNCLAANLWIEECGRTAVFGGDYDRLGQAVIAWVKELKKARVSPIIVFDGGYEQRKERTVLFRMRSKVAGIASASPLGDGSHAFPLLLRQVVRDAAVEAGVTIGQADLEADADLAALARRLKCPVLSADSDFFVFGAQFAPLAWLDSSAVLGPDDSFYVGCRLFRGGPLPPPLLPLLAALLGNDFVGRAYLAHIRSRLTSRKKRSLTRINAIVQWLQEESFESAVCKILEPLKKERKKQMIKVLKSVVDCYTPLDTPLDTYILPNVDIDFSTGEADTKESLMKKLTDESDKIEKTNDQEVIHEDVVDIMEEVDDVLDEESEESENDVSESEVTPDEESSGCENVENERYRNQGSSPDSWPKWYLERSRRGLLPPCLNTLLSLRCFFCTPQVEDYNRSAASSVAFPLVAATAGIVLGSGQFRYFSRSGYDFKTSIVPTSPPGPSLIKIPELEVSLRKEIIEKIMDIPSETQDLPKEWQLFVAAVIYWAKNMTDPPVAAYHVHALALMLIVIYIFDKKIGYFRNKRPFMARYGRFIKKMSKKHDEVKGCIDSPDEQKHTDEASSAYSGDPGESVVTDSEVKDVLVESIPIEEVLTIWPQICDMFHTDPELRTKLRSFRRCDVHAFAGLQCVVEQAIVLNAILLMPYHPTLMNHLYNGTFLYNACARLSRASNCTNAVSSLLKEAPQLLKCHQLIVKIIIPFLRTDTVHYSIAVRVRKKKKKKKEKSSSIQVIEKANSDKEEDCFSDIENKFSILAKIS